MGALRTSGLLTALALGAGLAGCNSGGGSGDEGLAAADISTTDGAVAQASTFVQILGAMDLASGLSGDAGPAAVGGVTTQTVTAATDDCPNGGTATDTGPTNKNVGSPFTQKSMSVRGINYSNCKNTSSAGGITSSVTLNGTSESGSVDDGAYGVYYIGVGQSRDTPLNFAYDTKYDALDLKMKLGVHLRDDFREGTADEKGEFLFNIDGSYTLGGTVGGQTVPTTSGEFRYYFGTQSAPFKHESDSSGITISGEYGSTLGGALSTGLSCPSGSVQIATTEELQDNEGGQSPFSAGTLELSAGGNKATVKFNNNDTVTVTVGSSSQTLSYADLLAESATCANLGLAGLYMASGFTGVR